MATLVLTCPHCDAQRIAFTLKAEFPCGGDPNLVAVGATCNGCQMPICATLMRTPTSLRSQTSPMSGSGDLAAENSHFILKRVFPERIAESTPLNIPEAVAKAFRQAESSLKAGHLDAACSMYRKAMELGLKAFSPDIEAWKIEKRIDKMAAENRITPELKAWAHELRLDGNDALHGEDDASEEMANQMHELCKFLLTYLYTLPAQVAEAQARRQAE